MNNDIFNEIVQTEIKHTHKKTSVYKPWHKPRKQHVREYQWYRSIKKYLLKKMSDHPEIKLLTLPGEDFLDIFHFANRFREESIDKKIKFLGFLDANETVRNSALNRTRVLYHENINKSSDLKSFKIEEIANTNSGAYQELVVNDKFDIVNLDLTQSVIKSTAKINYIDMLTNIFDFQIGKEKWLLFLTSRCDKDTYDPKMYEIIERAYIENINKFTDFQQKALKKPLESLSDTDVRNHSIIITKWILARFIRFGYNVELKSSNGYTVQPNKSTDMMSIVIFIEKRSFPTKETTSEQIEQKLAEDELLCALNSLEIVQNKYQNIDEILNDNQNLYKQRREESKKLLQSAKHDIVGYNEWADKESKKVQIVK